MQKMDTSMCVMGKSVYQLCTALYVVGAVGLVVEYRGGPWVGLQPAQAAPYCTKCNSAPINGQCTNHRSAV